MNKWLIGFGCVFGLMGAVLAAIGSVLIIKNAVSLRAMGVGNGTASLLAVGNSGLAVPIALTVAGIVLIIGMAICLLKS